MTAQPPFTQSGSPQAPTVAATRSDPPVEPPVDPSVSATAAHCPDPDALLAREDMTRGEKLARLREWELDLREKLVADEEAMTSDLAPEDPCQAGEQLRGVMQARERLGTGLELHPTPSKQG